MGGEADGRNVPKRIFVAIGVSSPEDLEALPGVITAAKRMAKWGKSNGYLPVLVHDEPEAPGGPPVPVTVERLRAEIAAAIGEVKKHHILERIVVFFAGHGTVQRLEDQYWILSDWQTDSNQAVKLVNFQQMLEYYGPRQVSIIADACQEFDKKFAEVVGSAILFRPREKKRAYELDRFFAADALSQSFMVKAQGEEAAYCLFSEVLLDALEGDAPEAFERTDGGRCVTSQSLFLYLRDTIPLEAGRLKLSMTPRSYPGFVTDRNYLRGSDRIALGAAPGASGELLRPRSGRRVDLDAAKDSLDDIAGLMNQIERDDRREEMLHEAMSAPLPEWIEKDAAIAVSGAEVAGVAASSGIIEPNPALPGNWFDLSLDEAEEGRDWADVAIDLADGRTAYLCAVSGFLAALHVHSATETSLLQRRVHEQPAMSEKALDLLARANAGLLDENELIASAAVLRMEKHNILTIGCIVSQFYDAVRDSESIMRVASYYKRHEQMVPLDVALLSGGRIHSHGSQLLLDIEATQKREPRNDAESALGFTYHATRAASGVVIGGRAPWMRTSWSAIETANIDESSFAWRDAALAVLPHLAPGPFSAVKPAGRDALLSLVGIEDHEPEPIYQAAFG